MPIRPENRARYPANWKSEIRPRILARAKNCCERCKAKNGTTIARHVDGITYMTEDGRVHDASNGDFYGYARGSEYPAGSMVTIVLTIAHLDHTPENCTDGNLLALCQRCHLRNDRKHHAISRKKNRAADAGQLQLAGLEARL
uniref:HNH endonuclease n=1 Tax=Mycena chlorophos TaxID=658473 RepID=A0ABQ0L143_MYCCL|nr:predicted protein [Mycena chlorophos]